MNTGLEESIQGRQSEKNRVALWCGYGVMGTVVRTR